MLLRRHDLRNALTVIRPTVKINLRRHREAVYGVNALPK
jgi:hypothetical protein